MTRLATICLVMAIVIVTGTVYAGSITGTVTNGSTGISGITVQVYAFPPVSDEPLTSAVTVTNGTYTISGLAAGQYMVAAFPGITSAPYMNQIYNNTLFYMDATPITVSASGTVSNINFALAPSGMITGTVIESGTGNPIEGIWVVAENYDIEEAMFSEALTDADGVYRMTGLPPGDYRLDADCDGTGLNYTHVYYNGKSNRMLADKVTLSGTSTVPGINFVLSPGGAVSGTVTEANSAPIAGIRLFAIEYGTENYCGETESDASGNYTIVGLAAGTYMVRACPSCVGQSYVDEYYDNTDWKDADEVIVTVGQTTTNINFVLAQGTSISGTVTGWSDDSNDYAPLAGAEVSAENISTGAPSGWAQTESDGSYTMTGIAPGSYRVRAHADTYSSEFYPNSTDWSGAQPVTTTIQSPATGINFSLEMGGQISGTITDQDTGLPITQGVWINAQPSTGEPWGSGTNEIGQDGNYIINGLPAGTYKICTNVTGYDQEFYNNTNDWMQATLVEVVVGLTTPNINLSPKKEAGGRFVGIVKMADGTPVDNANVNANSMSDMKNKWTQTGNDGTFELTGITSGQWRLRANPPMGEDYLNLCESDEMILTMPEGASEVNGIEVVLPTVNLVGQVKLPNGQNATWAPVNIEKEDRSSFMFTNTDQQGYFRKGGLSVGTYRIRLEIPWGTSGIVRPDPCTVVITDTNVVKNVGILTYATAVKHIVGQVQRDDTSGVSGVQVNACRRGGEGWANTQTDVNGAFYLDVAPGTWEVMIHPDPQQQNASDWVYTGYPEVLTFTDDASEETQTATFTVTTAGSRIIGRVTGPNGETIRQGGGWIDIRDDSGKGNNMPMANGGDFNIPVSAGTYNLWIGVDRQTYPYWSCPQLPTVTVEDGQIVNVGTITLVAKNSGVSGQVTRSGDSRPIQGVRVNAWQNGGGWSDATTNEQGNYQLSLLAGTWQIQAEAPYTSDYISGQPPVMVVVSDGQIINDVNFQLQQASGSIAISLRDGSGILLTDIDGGWAYARLSGNSMQPVGGSPVSNGQATIKLPANSYVVGVCLPPNTGYTLSGEQNVTVESSQVDVNITTLSNNSTISGTFYTDQAKTHPATGILGEVFAMQKMGGVWQSTQINSNGTFNLSVAAGEWNLGYWIRSSGYINNPPPDSKVTVGSGETATYDFVLMGADATIQGSVLDPNGNPMNHAWVWAHSEGDGTPGSRIDNGSQAMEPIATFTINVPSGHEYEVGSNAPSDWGYIQPDFERVTPQSGQTVTVTLRYKQSNAAIVGNVFYKDGDTNVPCEWAWVNAWSNNGQHSGTNTDDQGNYHLNVAAGTTWHLEAMYHPKESQSFFKTQMPVDVTVNASEKTANLEVTQSERDLPPAASAIFDPNVGWNTTLEDGTRIEIPAGAIPADDNVAISFTPIVDELQSTATDKPVGWGYAISIAEQSTGSQITGNFNTNVLITFSYRDEDLNEMGLTEDDISPAYYSTTSDSWTKVESFTVDKDSNTVTVQVNHFSTWALTGGPGIQADDGADTVAMTIKKCLVKAGVLQGVDSIDITGSFASSPADLNDIDVIDINIISLTDDAVIYSESIDCNASRLKAGKFKYAYRIPRGADGNITSLAIDFNKKTIALKALKVDLTGLACDLQLNIDLGVAILTADINEATVNGKNKLIPIRLMRTYQDTLRIKSAKAKASATPTADSFTVKGELAVGAVDDVNLVEEDVTLTWGDQTFVIPAGSMVRTSAVRKAYKCSNITLDDESIANCKFDLDKCTFNINIKHADLDVTSGDLQFGIGFAAFDEEKSINLP